MNLRIPVALTLAVLAAGPVIGAPVCENFEPGTYSEAQLLNEFGGAVLLLQVGDTRTGTGYLVDAKRGYVITAAHVVEGPGKTIQAFSTRLPKKPIRATVVKIVGNDLALLKLDTVDLVSNVKPVDITLRYPARDRFIYSIGFPKLGDENPSRRAQRVELMSSAADGSIEVKQVATLGGASGGPLVEATGAALGTCRQGAGIAADISRYAPMKLAIELLDLIPMSSDMVAIDEKIRAGKMDRDELADRLFVRSGNPTNLDLYAWVRNVSKRPKDYDGARALFGCPILPALMHRGLDDLVIVLAGYAAPIDIAEANLNISYRENAIGNHMIALAKAREAEVAFLEAGDQSGIAKSRLAKAEASLSLGDVKTVKFLSEEILAKPTLLSGFDQARTFEIVGTAAAKAGDTADALSNFKAASKQYKGIGYVTFAGDTSVKAADLMILEGDLVAAKGTLTDAVTMYEESASAKSATGYPIALYKLATVQKVAGDETGTVDTMGKYLRIFPKGKYAGDAAAVVKGSSDLPHDFDLYKGGRM